MTKELIDQTPLVFIKETHDYFYDGVKQDSVTSWIKSHWPDFNVEAISPYTAKACTKEITAWKKGTELIEKDFPKCVKLFKENWQQEVRERKSRKTTKVTAKEVAALWKQNGSDAADEGTRIHELIETAIKEGQLLEDYMDERVVVAAMNAYHRVLRTYDDLVRVVPELRLCLPEYKLAGTIDVFIDREGSIILLDWKTNKELSWDGYKKGLTKLTEDLKNSNLQLYTLQLSTYAYMCEQIFGKPIHRLIIYHTTEDKLIPITYEKELIEKLLQEKKLENGK